MKIQKFFYVFIAVLGVSVASVGTIAAYKGIGQGSMQASQESEQTLEAADATAVHTNDAEGIDSEASVPAAQASSARGSSGTERESSDDTIKNKSHESESGDREDSDSEGDDENERGGAATSVATKPATQPAAATPAPKALPTFTLAQVAAHKTTASCYTAINGEVFDVTSWIAQHPGGSQAIISLCGIDGSAAFNGQHGGQARPASELASFKIGTLIQ